ncbi:Protein kinase domain-containing protein [Aphelenchoides besseyi]|nr:Protein kinase domain-containing protein [Aphelenchoides besseyi]KAI6193815.1 Protein kinase domain-containing protein [Aphelenchoides besseyi]
MQIDTKNKTIDTCVFGYHFGSLSSPDQFARRSTATESWAPETIHLFDDSNFDFESYLDHRMGERMFGEHEDSLIDDLRPKSTFNQKHESRKVSDYLFGRRLHFDHRGSQVFLGTLKEDSKIPISVRAILLDPKNVKHIARELALLTQCCARSILQYENGMVAGDVLFLEFPFVQRLSELIKREVEKRGGIAEKIGVLGEKLVTKMTFDILQALKGLHSLGLVHGSVNSDNIVVGLNGQFQLMGLDLAYTHGPGLSIENCAEIATNMPAEQLGSTKTGFEFYSQHEIEDLRPFAEVGFSYTADIWAIGCLVFHSVCGLPLFGYPTKENVNEFIELVTFGEIPNITDYHEPNGQPYSKLLAELVGACLHRDFNSRPTATRLLHFPVFQHLRLQRYQLRPVNYPLDLNISIEENANYRPAAEVLEGSWLKALTEGKTYAKPTHWKVETKPKPSKRLTNNTKTRVYVRVRDPRKNRIRYMKITYDAQNLISFDDQEVAEKMVELLTSGFLELNDYMLLLSALQSVLVGCVLCRPPTNEPNIHCSSQSANSLRIWITFNEKERNPKELIGCAQINVEQSFCTCRFTH